MKIVCEFNDYEEMMGFAANLQQGQKSEPMPTMEEDPGEPEPVEEPAKAENLEPEKKETKTYTLVDVRAKLGELQKSGKRDQVKELLKSFDAAKLSDVPEEKYAELMEKAGEL